MIKNNLFNKPTYKETLKSLMMPTIIISMIGIVIAFIQHFSMADETILSISMIATLICMFIGGFVLPISAFNFLNEQKKSIFMLSLPVKRSGLYISKVLAVMTCQLAILSIVSAVSSGLVTISFYGNHSVFSRLFELKYLYANGADAFVHMFFPTLLSTVIGSLLIIGANLLACSISGKLKISIVISLIILFLPRILLNAQYFMLSMSFYLPSSNLGVLLSPTYNMITGLVLSLSGIWNYYEVADIALNLGTIVYTFVLAIIYTSLGLVIFVKRKAETAEQSMPNNILKLIFACCTTLFFTYFTALYFIDELSVRIYQETWIGIAVCIFTSLIIYIIAGVISYANKKDVIKSLKFFPLVIVFSIGVGLLSTISYNSVGNIKIDRSEIESVQINLNTGGCQHFNDFDTYNEMLIKNIMFTDETIIDELYSGEISSGTYGQKYMITYNLKNGKTFDEFIGLSPSDREALNEFLSKNNEFKHALSAYPSINEIDGIYINSHNTETLSTDAKLRLYDTGVSEMTQREVDMTTSTFPEEPTTMLQLEPAPIPQEEYIYDSLIVVGFEKGNKFYSEIKLTNKVPETVDSYLEELYVANIDAFNEFKKLCDSYGNGTMLVNIQWNANIQWGGLIDLEKLGKAVDLENINLATHNDHIILLQTYVYDENDDYTYINMPIPIKDEQVWEDIINNKLNFNN